MAYPDIFDVFNALYKAHAPRTHLYSFADYESLVQLDPALRKMGWHVWKAVVWDKMSRGMGYHYPGQIEYIIFAEKRSAQKPYGRRLNEFSTTDYLAHEPDMAEASEDILHGKRVKGAYPTEKPVPVMRKLIANSIQPGEVVVDPWAGSGSSGEAALLAGGQWWGCDIKASACTRIEARLGGLDAA